MNKIAIFRESITSTAVLVLGLILLAALLIALAIFAPQFGTTSDPFISYLVISFFSLPFTGFGFLYSLLIIQPLKRKMGLIAVSGFCLLFSLWPVLLFVVAALAMPMQS